MIPLPSKRFRPRKYKPGGSGSWSGHLPFAHDLTAAVAPALIVELGAHRGESYFGFCQSVEELGGVCRCYAVDTWRGDVHSGRYGELEFAEVDLHNKLNYRRFSTLLRSTFDEANLQFADETIDILHIDGQHLYESVRHDFESWLPKVRPGGIVLIHDITARHEDFGVWRYWDEIKSTFRSFEFFHSWGLGVIQKNGAREERKFLDFLFESCAADQAFIASHYANLADLLDLEHKSIGSTQEQDYAFLQVFPNITGEYNEGDSILTPFVNGEWTHHIVPLPQGSPAGPIRIDLANFPGVIEVGEILLRKTDSAVIVARWSGFREYSELSCGGHLQPFPQGEPITFLSVGDDPQLYLPDLTSVTNQPLVVEVMSRVTRDVAGSLSALQNLFDKSQFVPRSE